MRTSIRFRYAVMVEGGILVPEFIFPLGPGMTTCIGLPFFSDALGCAVQVEAEKRGVKIK